MEQRWLIRERVVVPPFVKEMVGGHPMVAESLVRRGFLDKQSIQGFLNPELYQPSPASELPGIETAVERIWTAVNAQEKICVWGDFDVDGQTATTLLVSVLTNLGADVVYHIPVRATESHGIKIPWLDKELDKGVRLVLTCDTGIDAVEAIEFANQSGVDVVVTDHHELPNTLPSAKAIVNPHLLNPGHPLETLPGVGVAYKLAEALYERAGMLDRAQSYLDLVALGIVADVAVQVRDTRYLLQRGLVQLRNTNRLGLRLLMESAQIDIETIAETDIGFSLAPRLNALGRLSDAHNIVELLTTEDMSRARILTSQLESLNAKRRQMTDDITKAAISLIERDTSLLEYAALVLENPSWPPGIIGIVANRLSEKFLRPVVLLSAPTGEMARGSARSVYGCHITEAIATQSELLMQYGGHAQAAGLSLLPENIPAFRRGLSRAVLSQMGGVAVEPPLLIDGFVSIDELSLELIDDLGRLAPFGPGNPALNLAVKNVHIVSQRKIGRDGSHLRLTVADDTDHQLDLVWWQWDGADIPSTSFDLAFNLSVNLFRGQRAMQAVWLSSRLMEPEISYKVVAPSEIHVVDYRSRQDLRQVLAEVTALPDALLWREGPASQYIHGMDRLELHPATTLIIWSPPASYEILRDVLAQVEPVRIILVSDTTDDLDKAEIFLRYLTGLVKYILNHEESTRLQKIAAAMGHNVLTVRIGLSWLAARGFTTPVYLDDGDVRFTGGGNHDQDLADYILDELKTLLTETAAYRRHFKRMDAAHLIEIAGLII